VAGTDRTVDRVLLAAGLGLYGASVGSALVGLLPSVPVLVVRAAGVLDAHQTALSPVSTSPSIRRTAFIISKVIVIQELLVLLSRTPANLDSEECVLARSRPS
jgi:hypothetical protein